MRSNTLPKMSAALLLIVLTAQAAVVPAFETDQYNLPKTPLADIGDEVTEYVAENLRRAIDKINARIAARVDCLDGRAGAKNCGAAEKERAELVRLRSAAAIVREVFEPLGGGIPPFTRSGTWMEEHDFAAQPARYKTSFGDSIYRAFPTNYWTISETVKIYGVEFGTDKIAHLFQQGYTYWQISERAASKGASAEEAALKAARWGRMTENTFYGTLISGVFSNADLAANYAGLKFYRNLTREVKVGDAVRPPILVLENGFWAVNENVDLREALLKPFVSAHFNEALNPSVLIPLFGFRAFVRRQVEKRACPDWRKRYPDASAADFRILTEKLQLWHGEDYGFKKSRREIGVAVCFDDSRKISDEK